MNTKIIVAVVIGIAMVGLTGAASAYIHTETDIYGDLFSSASWTSVSNFPIEERYESTYIATLKYPTYPPVDLSWTGTILSGDTYSHKNEVVSAPSGTTTSTAISNPSEIYGSVSFWDCALWGNDEPQKVIELPVPVEDAIEIDWSSKHTAGSAYPGRFSECHSIYWP